MSTSFHQLRICLVGPIAPPAGGMANQTHQLLELLRQEGAEVALVAVNAPYKPAIIGKVPGVRALFRLLPFLATLFSATGKAQVVHIMANSGWSWHLFAAPAIWIARWHGTPVVLNYRGGHAESFFQQNWRWVALSLRRCSVVIVPSVFLQQVFTRYQQADTAVPVAIVPNILDQQLFYPQQHTADYNANASIKTPHFIVTRNLEAIYDVATAINAFALIYNDHPQARLTIAGSGPLLAQLQQQVQQLNIGTAVHFSGRLSSAQMAILYRSADIMLNSSLVDNSPNSLIEALACAVPVVSTDIGGISHLVQHRHDALLFSPGDYHAMYQLATELLHNAPLRQQLSANGLKNSSRFHWSAVRHALAKHYHSAIAAKEPQA